MVKNFSKIENFSISELSVELEKKPIKWRIKGLRL